ncbi:ATP-binding protein [Desulfovibrio sp. JC010]|uniref:PAS domain-containing sensor histidine kinase n=1 Tax=Desulfovibrio sp. JC010 TaxID=2593641 RepID=UPI0013D02B02|nr:ATP-binding protein [Desulfovibrio sp. JC010]NDV27419.1 GHKL domain-containing protein [Desulfovibrio sp. JC010]
MHLTTDFAPAERAPVINLQEMADSLSTGPHTAILHALPIPIIIINSYRQIVFCNSVFQSITKTENPQQTVGLRPGEALGCIHAFANEAGCGTSKFCRDCGAAASIIKSLAGTVHSEECRILRHSPECDEALDLQVFTSPFEYEDEDLIIFTVLDISSEKRKKNLERLFFHDILNLATGLRYASQMLCRNTSSSDTRKQCLKMDNTISQMVEEIQAQRDVSRAEDGSLKIPFKPVSSTGTLKKIRAMYSTHPLCVDRQISISNDCDELYFDTESTILIRALGNMVKNGLEASEQDETVTIGCEKKDGSIHFWVHNNFYIPSKIQRQIFKRSFSTKGTGRGLGTYSMKLLVEKYLKGQVRFESTPEKGTVFIISLPEKQEQDTE